MPSLPYNVWAPALPAAAALTGTEPCAVVQGGVTVQTSPAGFLAYASPFLRQHPGYVVNNWYQPFNSTTGTGSISVTNIAKFVPFIAEQSITISSLAVHIGTAGTSNIQLAIYAADPVTKRPTGAALSSTANAANTSANTTIAIALAADVALTAGSLYWLGFNTGDSLGVYVAASSPGWMSWLNGSATLNNLLQTSGNTPLSFISTPLAFGTWGNLTAATWTEGLTTSYSLIIFKVFSIP